LFCYCLLGLINFFNLIGLYHKITIQILIPLIFKSIIFNFTKGAITSKYLYSLTIHYWAHLLDLNNRFYHYWNRIKLIITKEMANIMSTLFYFTIEYIYQIAVFLLLFLKKSFLSLHTLINICKSSLRRP